MEKRIVISTGAFHFWEESADPAQKILTAIKVLQELDIAFDGIDMCYPFDNVTNNSVLPDWAVSYIKTYPIKSFHIGSNPFKKMIAKGIDAVKEYCEYTGCICNKYEVEHIVLHADIFEETESWLPEVLLKAFHNMHVNIEYMDRSKAYGNHPDHFVNLFESYADFFFVPDVAHFQDIEDKENILPDLCSSFFTGRSNFIHVSNHSNEQEDCFCDDTYKGIPARHKLCCADLSRVNHNLLRKYESSCFVVEGIIPPSREGVQMLKREVELINNL